MKAMAPASKLGMIEDALFKVGRIFLLILTFSVSSRTTPCRKPVHQKERDNIRTMCPRLFLALVAWEQLMVRRTGLQRC